MNNSQNNSIEIILNGRLDEIANLASELDRFCNDAIVSDLVKNQINLVLEELYTNTANYGLVGISNGQVIINLLALNNQLEIRYKDNGIAFNPLEIADPDLMLSLDDRPIGGLGVFFVKAMTDNVTYSRVGGWNQLLMQKSL
ncbi:RsbW Anti-sigma regulatory factor (Ser/Thr protein kinase) [Methylophilaceae bacterium]|jgi:serine/threonine-protein kinase RsbW